MTEIKRHTICANGIPQYYMEAGEGAPVVLLHGFPETSYAWRHQIPELARKYRVIAPDLRGYGETDKPATGYDKGNMANDLRELMRSLEISKIALVGHDRGARVATRFAKDHPEALDRLVVMDNVPTRIVARDFNPIMAKAHWFFIFNQILDLPGRLSRGARTFGWATSSRTGPTIPTPFQAKHSIITSRHIGALALFVVRWLIVAPTPCRGLFHFQRRQA
jgi:haloacetate dehalogenase